MTSATMLTGCAGELTTEPSAPLDDKLSLAAAVSGRWVIPDDILDIGDDQDVTYTGAGSWNGPSSCSGGMKAGTAVLKDYLEDNFPQISLIGGYSCRAIVGNSSKMSVHGTGRALDIHIPTVGGAADNTAGDAIGNWLIANAEAIGVQYIIWDRTQWTANRPDGTKGRYYGGAHPHHDHLHVELSVAGGNASTSWFDGPMTAPQSPGCEPLPATGGIIDNDDPCMSLRGPSVYWRDSSEGYGGGLVWTRAFRSSSPSNWANWEVHVVAPGSFEVEVYLDPAQAQFQATGYRVTHEGGETRVEIDQSSSDGWTSLGVYSFGDSGSQGVTVFDNVSFTPTSNQRSIAVDALRLTPSQE